MYFIDLPVLLDAVALKKEFEKRKIAHAGINTQRTEGDGGGGLTRVHFTKEPSKDVFDNVARATLYVKERYPVKAPLSNESKKLELPQKLLGA